MTFQTVFPPFCIPVCHLALWLGTVKLLKLYTARIGFTWLHCLTENMEIVRSHVHRNISTNDAVNTLPLYRSAPPLEVRLEDFELYAMDRLRVLKGISDGLSRGKKPEEMDQLVKSYIYDHLTIGFSKHTGDLPWNILYSGKKSTENAYGASAGI